MSFHTDLSRLLVAHDFKLSLCLMQASIMMRCAGLIIAPTSLSPSVMSTPSHTDIPSSTFLSIFDVASNEYKRKTGQDLQTHPFADQLDSCASADAILAVFQRQVDALNQARKCHQNLMNWLNPTVNILFLFSATLGEGISLVSLTAWFFLSLLSFTFT
jgi:hypothetical protein